MAMLFPACFCHYGHGTTFSGSGPPHVTEVDIIFSLKMIIIIIINNTTRGLPDSFPTVDFPTFLTEPQRHHPGPGDAVLLWTVAIRKAHIFMAGVRGRALFQLTRTGEREDDTVHVPK
ncbi:hypothetical protein [Komagataeibacter rhaeticus]|uniref:hypothetical protein n=2 Tax=Komagataeibacter rhaeticus TaxID=215221 RepID=UPI0015E8D357|nr:hypothetical protein [Komagataeibacter rhaeticus]